MNEQDKRRRFIHSWTCPSCGFVHDWDWPAHDRPRSGDRIHFECEACATNLEMVWSGTDWQQAA